ncbi:MAG: excinuclease ABC subunit UvrA [Pirellulales bacterium]
MSEHSIRLRGVRVHNLQSIDLDLPRQQWIAVCGVSGSGKTSLALDTLYAEGQRRYIESFSAYTRQFLERLDKPAADRIDGIPPAVAVTRRTATGSSRTTVGTVTETNDYLRLFLARVGEVICHACHLQVRRETPESAARELGQLAAGTRLIVGYADRPDADETAADQLRRLKESGVVRVVLDERLVPFDNVQASDMEPVGSIDVVLDRLVTGKMSLERLRESLETAAVDGQGEWHVHVAMPHGPEGDGPSPNNGRSNGRNGGTSPQVVTIDGRSWVRRTLNQRRVCQGCGLEYPEPEPQLLSFNSPMGACPACEGFGNLVDIDCPTCGGDRLGPNALAVRLAGKNMADICRFSIREAIAWFEGLELTDWQRDVGRVMLEQIRTRLDFLRQVGLDYLALGRTLRRLSRGERQRVALTSALGSNLVQMLYVLDEPSSGLHPHDVRRLTGVLRALRDRGNTVVVVEHEPSLIGQADHVVELGPGAGENGGRVIFQGTPAEMMASRDSPTGGWLTGRRGTASPPRRRDPQRGWIRLIGARGRNLKEITVEFPLGVLCVVTGVSGAGKSTLVLETLVPALLRRLRREGPSPCDCDDVVGDGQLEDLVLIDQAGMGRSSRSNPVTYIKAFDEIRSLFADTVEARTNNFGPGHFSFNVEGGRCDRCRGEGQIAVDMQFLADVTMRCEQCQGRRYRPEILRVTYRGRNIAEVLDLTVREAVAFFRGRKKLQSRLKPLIDVGLDYLRLGQPASTLSAGEAQRMKLSRYVGAIRRGRTLFVLDEPTNGLHYSDVLKLLDCFDSLLDVGHSLIVVEHNLQLIRAADYVIDLGPGAADDGGRVIAHGTPETIAAEPKSITGRFLTEEMTNDGRRNES